MPNTNMSLEGADILWGNSFSGKYSEFYNWMNNPYDFRDNTNIRPGYADTNPNDWRIDSTSPEGLKNLPNIKSTFLNRADAVIPFGYNSADLGGIFDSMTKIKGSTFGDAYAAAASYNLMGLNEGMANYAKNQYNDPLTKDNLKPFVTSSDSGFMNPLAAEHGAIVNYGKVQAEKDEIIVLPDGSIVDPASKTFHNKMKSDETTEYLPQGSIVFSNKVMVKKSSFEGKEGDVVAATISNYSETEKPELPKEFKISDLFGSKKEMSSAELIQKVKDMFPIKETPDNGTENPKLSPIDVQTNEQNKAARLPYIAAIFDKVKGKMKTDEQDKPVKANAGAILQAAQAGGNILGGWIGQYMAYQNKKANDKLISDWEKQSNDYLNLGTGIGVASTLAQDPYIPKKNTDIQRAYLREMQDKVPYYMQDAGYNQLSADSNMRTRSLFENSTSFNRAANAATAYDANLLDAKSKLATNYANQSLNMQNAKLNAQLGYEEKWAGEEQSRISKILQNLNAIKSNLGDYGMNYGNQKAALKANVTNARVGQNNQYTNTSMGNIQSIFSGAGQAAGLMGKSGGTTTPEATTYYDPLQTNTPSLPNGLVQPPQMSYINQPTNNIQSPYNYKNSLYSPTNSAAFYNFNDSGINSVVQDPQSGRMYIVDPLGNIIGEYNQNIG